jgi:hypothetical protein
MARRAALLFLLLATAPAAAAGPNDRMPSSWMIGRWFGTGQPNDKSEMWLAQAFADGRFHVQFRRCRQGKAFDTTNDGTWVLDGAKETISIDTVDGQKLMPRHDRYTILSHTNAKQTYRYEGTGFVYTSRKVAANFAMPRCDLTS